MTKILLTLLLLPSVLLAQYVPSGPVFPTGSDFATGMVEAWPMNEGTGTTFYTVSGSGNDMTASNITWGSVSGFPGSVPIFNGTTSIADGANYTNTNFDGTTPFSVCAWLNLSGNGSGGSQIIGTSSNTSSETGWIFYVGPSTTRKLSFFIINSVSPANYIGTNITPAISLSALTQACVTYDGSQSESGVAMYLNGISETVTSDGDTLTLSAANPTPVEVAQRPDTSTYALNGTVAYITIWDVKKTATQIANYYALGPAVP